MVEKPIFYKKSKIAKQISRDRYLQCKLSTKVFVSKKYKKPKYKKDVFAEECF